MCRNIAKIRNAHSINVLDSIKSYSSMEDTGQILFSTASVKVYDSQKMYKSLQHLSIQVVGLVSFMKTWLHY